MAIRFIGERKAYTPKDTDEVRCELHGVVTTWGALDGIQRMALEAGLDADEALPCLLAPVRG
jgi:hypothetical protein